MPTGNSYSGPAKALTIDQAYRRNYVALRKRFYALAESEPDRPRRCRIYDALEDVAIVLEHDLIALGLSDELRAILAEDV